MKKNENSSGLFVCPLLLNLYIDNKCTYQVRISSKSGEPRAKGMAWHHANCFMGLHSSVQVQKLSGWDNLPPSDQEAVLVHVKVVPSASKTGMLRYIVI